MGEYSKHPNTSYWLSFNNYSIQSFVQLLQAQLWGYIYYYTLLMKKVHQIKNHHISSFILKLTKLLEDPRSKNIIKWSSDGDSITIDNHNEMLQIILAHYFNHTKLSSFIRQLNLYGFKKISQRGTQMIYKHPCFIRDKIILHKSIKRQRKNKIKTQKTQASYSKDQNSILETEKIRIKGLQDIYFRIKKENQKINNQTTVVKNHVSLLSQIKDSLFFRQLKFSYIEEFNKQECLVSQKIIQKINEQPSTPQAQTTENNQQKQRQNYNFEYMNEQNIENQQNDDNNNQMGYFNQKIEELGNNKMSIRDDRQYNFWKYEQIEIEGDNQNE